MATARVDDTPRAMWLLNHTAARKFEIPMMKSSGIDEVFLPKIYPDDPNFRSASVDWGEDKGLSIDAHDLSVLNATDWYKGGTRSAWEIANKYFDLAFIMMYSTEVFESAQKHFKGQVLWRTYGLSHGNTYSSVLSTHLIYQKAYAAIRRLYDRFWFAEAYDHLHEVEAPFLAKRSVFLPLGMNSASRPKYDEWNGEDRRVLFVCPDINFNPVYEEIYRQFKINFPGLPYVVGGAQSIAVDDPRVLGYLPYEDHLKNMRNMRLMFYHSTEPTHIHFHPFEAVVAGMPLIFMGGGILDRFGGVGLPGRCATVREARSKMDRILAGDEAFVRRVRDSQKILLEPMKPENCEKAWSDGISRVLANAHKFRVADSSAISVPTKIAILATPTDIQAAEDVADLLSNGARLAEKELEVVIGVARPNGPGVNRSARKSRYNLRDFGWETADHGHVARALHYGRTFSKPKRDQYVFPNDGMNNFMDCDLWVLASGRLKHEIVPFRPCILHADRSVLRASIAKGALPESWMKGIATAADVVVTNEEGAAGIFLGVEGVEPSKLRVISPRATDRDSASYWEAVEECL